MNQHPARRHRRPSISCGAAIRIASSLLLVAVIVSCGGVPGLHEETPTTAMKLPLVRVLLSDDAQPVRIQGDGSFSVECLRAKDQDIFYATRPIVITNVGNGRMKVTTDDGDYIAEDVAEINLLPRAGKNRLRVQSRWYRGMLKLLPSGQGLQTINLLYMEDYLRGVVPPELGPRTEEEIEAVKAQAVAARTYAMAHLGQYAKAAYDLKSSVVDQVYEGMAVENKLVNKAIDATAGSVLMYNGEFVQAYYHSTCGGMTDNIASVWERQELPYLKPVSDGGVCSWSKYFRWEETYTEPQLRLLIEQYLSTERGREITIGRILDVAVMERTPGGRVARLTVRTETDHHSFYKDRIRWVIRRGSNPDLILASARFDVHLSRDTAGNLHRITLSGGGYGHGVGMCQCGAIGYSRQGWTCEQILTHYYAGVEVKKLY